MLIKDFCKIYREKLKEFTKNQKKDLTENHIDEFSTLYKYNRKNISF